MLKKRILASTMASVMALSSVSVVAFADDVEAPKTEAVTRKQLEDYLKSLEDFVEKDLDDYGTTMSEYFENAYAAAEVVVEDKDADADDITAAYQMLKAVKNKLRIYTAAELKDLVKDNENIYDTENEMNEEFGDDIYESESWDNFESAYESAEDCLEETDSKIINDAYAELEAAAKALEEKDSVTKSAFRKTYNEYIDLVDEMEQYEDWRRGKATVGGNKLFFSTANKKLDFKGKVITFGELKDIVKGDCDQLPASLGDTTDTVDATKGDKKANWITFGGYGSATTLRDDVENAYQKFVTEKTSNKTTMSEIVTSYKAMKKAIEIFKGWEVDNVKRGSKSSIENLLDDYHDDIAEKLGSTAYGADGTAADTIAKAMLGQIQTGNSYTAGDITLAWSDSKLVIDTKDDSVEWKEGTVIKVNPDTGWFDVTVASSKYSENTSANTKSIKLKKGENLVKYLPINKTIIGTALDADCLNADRELSVGMTAFEACKAEDDKEAGERNYATAVTTTIDTRKTLNENSTKSAAYPLVYRVIKYALDDLFPEDDTYTKKEVADLVAKSNDLIDKTGDAAKFEAENSDLDEYRKAAKEWVAKANGTKGYKDGDAVGTLDAGNATAGWRYEVLETSKTIIGAGTNATTVYEALEGKYKALNDKLKKYPVSYGDIAETIAEVAEGIDSKAYGSSTDKIKALAETVAYDLSTLNDWGKDDCETFDDDHNFLFYNRLNADDSPNEGEKALKKNYDALLKAMEEATAAPAVSAGDVDGDGAITPADAKMILQGFLDMITLTADQIKAGDMDGDGDADTSDAKAVLAKFLEV